MEPDDLAPPLTRGRLNTGLAKETRRFGASGSWACLCESRARSSLVCLSTRSVGNTSSGSDHARRASAPMPAVARDSWPPRGIARRSCRTARGRSAGRRHRASPVPRSATRRNTRCDTTRNRTRPRRAPSRCRPARARAQRTRPSATRSAAPPAGNQCRRGGQRAGISLFGTGSRGISHDRTLRAGSFFPLVGHATN
jgi:hypothetical protein